MHRVEEYRQHAKDCRTLAVQTTQPKDKVALEQIAKAWDKVAALREHEVDELDEK